MITLFISFICFIIFWCYFYYLNNRYLLDKHLALIISFIISLTAFRPNSNLFLLLAHFVVISIILLFITSFRQLLSVILASVISILIVIAGIFNMHDEKRTYYQYDTNLANDRRLCLLADLHYPSATSKKELSRIVEKINNESSDYVILAGDIIDENTSKDKMIEVFEILGKIKAKVLYVYGNHDTLKYSISHKFTKEEFLECLKSNDIKLLDDEVLCEDDLCFVGIDRYDKDDDSALIKNLNQDKYNIIIDHEPKGLSDVSDHADMHLSGHTHGGQIFPMYYIYEWFKINDNNYGQKYFNDMVSINTSGIRGWGFDVRTSLFSEYVVIDLI